MSPINFPQPCPPILHRRLMLHMNELNVLIVIVMRTVVMSGNRVLARIEAEQIITRVVPLHVVAVLARPAVEDEDQEENSKHANNEQDQVGW